jgi:tetratricopeptide (TPR) repeat protein
MALGTKLSSIREIVDLVSLAAVTPRKIDELMPSLSLRQALERYSETLSAIETAQPQPTAEEVLAVLKARDAIHSIVIDKKQDTAEGLITVLQLDSRLKQQTLRITQVANLGDWRTSLHPPEQAWWWFIEEPVSKWDRFNWIWNVLAILCLYISLGLVADMSSRFLSSGPDIGASMVVVGQSLLTLLAAGGALTLAGQAAVKHILSSFKIPKTFWHKANFVVAILLLGGLVFLHLSLPTIAIWYNNRGFENYVTGRLISAQYDYERATKLNPDYAEAHYNLAVLYEDLQRIDEAQGEYLVAALSGVDFAYTNLTRLYILEGNAAGAIPWLRKASLLNIGDEAKYDLHKNLGWALLEQERYDESILELQAAIDLSPNRAPAHCLLAQVLEKKDDEVGALKEWENCLKFADLSSPDEDIWINMARQRLVEKGNK